MTRLPRASAALAATALLLLAARPAVTAEKDKPPAPRAAKAPAFRLNVYFPADFTDAAYQKTAFQQVLSSWKPKGEAPAPGKKAVVIAIIGRDGKLLGADFNLKSGIQGFDEAALEAVKKAAPFKPLPKAYPQTSIEEHWHFEVGS